MNSNRAVLAAFLFFSVVLQVPSHLMIKRELKFECQPINLFMYNNFSIFGISTSENLSDIQKAAFFEFQNHYWIYVAVIIVVALLLYGIRRFEKNRQLTRFRTEKNQFMEGLFQNAPFAVAVTDMGGRLTTINEMFEVVFEYSKNEIIGKKIDEFLLDNEKDNEDTSGNFDGLEEYQKVYKVCKRKSKSGELIDVELFTTPNFIEGEQYGYLIFYNDITKRLKIETELEKAFTTHRQVLDTLQDAYFEANPKGFITYCNRALAKAMGYEGKEEIIGKHFRNFVSRKNIRDFLENFKLLYMLKKPIEPFDIDYLTKDGVVFTSEIVASPIIEDDEAVGARGTIRDISLRVKAESMLREAKNAAEYRVNELSSINYVAEKISHSLNLEDILNSACREMMKVFPVRNAAISLFNKEQNLLEIKAFQTDNGTDESLKGKILSIDDNDDVRQMLSLKRTVIIENAQTDPRTGPIHEIARKNGTRSFMIVPLINRGDIIGTIGMPAKDPEYVFTADEVELAETIASQIAAAIENARLHAQTEKALNIIKQDLEIGKQIQSGFFPLSLPEINGWDIAAYFNPARQVSGDFYDFFQINDSQFYLLVVADVCDKGVGAALFMVLLRSLIRSYSEQSNNNADGSLLIQEIAQKVNYYIVNTHGQSNMFATVMLAILDSSDNRIHYVNGGHEVSLIVNADGKIINSLEPTGPAFGFSTEIPFEVGEIRFTEGDLMIAYTDGLTEAKNSSGEFYSNERFNKKVKSNWSSAYSIVKAIEYDVMNHIDGHKQFDDITLLAIRRGNNSLFKYHTLREKAEMDKLPVFKKFLSDTCKNSNVDQDISERLKLAVDEICTNIISYGYKNLETGEIALSISIKKDEVEVIIKDSGHKFDSSAAEDPELNEDILKRDIGGLGLFFVKETIDEVKYKRESGFNILSLQVKR